MNRFLLFLFLLLSAFTSHAQTMPMYGDNFVFKTRAGTELMWLYNTGKLKFPGYVNSDTTYFFTSDAAGNVILKKIYTGTPGAITQESDPVFGASAAAGISSTNITNWNSAFGWGNHALAGYLLQSSASSIYATKDSLNNYLLKSKADSTISANADVTANTAARHTHANKAALDVVSGTNTGDETAARIIALFGYTPANGANYLPVAGGALTGTVNFASGIIYTIGNQNFFANGSNMHFIYTGTNGIQFTNQTNTTALGSLSNTGNFNVIGTLTGSNLSGTNTGDETVTRINALYGYTPANGANYLALTGGTMTGPIAFTPQATPSAPASGFKLFAESSTGSFSWINSSGFVRSLRVKTQSQDIILYLQNKSSYTAADSSDLATLTTTVSGKQTQLSGTGLVQMSGTTVTYVPTLPVANGGTGNTTFTIGYLPYYNSSNILANSLVYQDASNSRISIGTTSTQGKLSVNESRDNNQALSVTSNYSVLSYNNQIVTFTNGTAIRFEVSSSGKVQGSVNTGSAEVGSYAIGTYGGTPAFMLFNGSGTGGVVIREYGTGGGISFGTSSSGSVTDQMILNTNGAVSIGNSNNTYGLDVQSTGIFRSTLTLATNTTSIAALYIPPGGTLTTSPTNGYIERDNYTLYVTTTNGRQAVAAGTVVTGTGGVNQYLKFYIASTPYYIAINTSLPN